MSQFQCVLFDLDGTLTDSGPGICKCAEYALNKVGIEEPNLENLRRFVGPPLSFSFNEYYGLDQDGVYEAVDFFHERYETIGIFENSVYPGVEEMLKTLKEASVTLAVASSKPQSFVHIVLEHFGIEQYFDEICGSKFEEKADGIVRKSDKEIIVERALTALYADQEKKTKGLTKEAFLQETAMVGDRMYDIEGALANHVIPVGVTFGYGDRPELEDAGAAYVVDTVEELTALLLNQ